ncbi:ESCRT-0 subunit protein hse1 [Vermiconidia calcicola]|uniref:ESCRT-0 subunit protein hse1 n=1 Tax=Vermiconidia calcicola TaxID=1690605 RepID=A0ACC3MPW8_9PEZI|nr:ESCRT-0 subunit protein hse1 [Vermiconidia calcicola]
MFRGQANPMDDAIVKATDENLTSENWEYILDVCDRVSASTSGPQQAVSSLIKRLAHRNANVQLYTLELANALSQNCGSPLHRELASKAFTDALLRLASDRNTHAQVKQKVLERMSAWTEDFGRNPELGIMEQAYQKLRVQQPGLMPPSKPAKQEVSADDRRKEDEELQMALALSVKEKSAAGQANGTVKEDSKPQLGQAQAGAPPSQQGTTAATVSRVKALYDFAPSEPGELAFRKNDIIAVLESVYKDWWKGSLRGNTGIFPLNYVEKLQDPTKEELEKDAQMEAEVFGEIKSVEKLLALLSVRGEGGSGGRRGEREEEEISELYQRTLSIRPKLIELIGKYSQKKDDFTQLNEKFIKARRDYEALLELSMSQPQYQQQFPIRPRQSSHQMYPPQQHQQTPYGGPQQGPPPQSYPPQAQPSVQAYPPQQPFAQQSQQHLPPQQDVQRFYSPAPSEPSNQQQPGYASPYPQQNRPPVVQPSNGPAPFHFIPGGVQGPPPSQQQEIRRKPSPQAPLSAGVGPGPSGPYGGQQPPSAFQGQIRPNSIHTLNSGNPQELGTGGYESPIDNRHSYPSAHMGVHHMQQPQYPMQNVQNAGYDAYPPQQQQQPPPQPEQAPSQSDRDRLPSRQRTQSFGSPTSVYSGQQDGAGPNTAQWPQQQQQQLPPQPSAPPPGVPGSPPMGTAPYQAYQAYQPQPQQQRLPSGGGGGGGDPGDFYR